jgi:hypothetical protein
MTHYLDILDDHIIKPDEVEKVEEVIKGVLNDLDAARTVYKAHPHWVCCNDELYVFDSETGLYSNSENIHFKIISKYEEDLYLLTKDKDGNLKKTIKGYGNSTGLQRNMIPQLKTLCINNSWLKDTDHTSLKKLLFLNGYLDLLTNIFYTTYDPSIVFFYRIQQIYNPLIIDNEYIKDIQKRLFTDPLGLEVGDFYMLCIARGIAGDIMKRILFGLGSTNGGKSTATKACVSSFGEYVGTFNAENLEYKNSSTDEAAKQRWIMLLRHKRLIFSNEIKVDEEKGTNIKLNGNDIKKISSGGDTLTGRTHGGLETEFIPHFLAIIFSNDLPQITPYDAAVDNRVKVIGFNKTFVEAPDNEYELKMDNNINEEISTDKFKQHFIMLIILRYIQFLNNNKIEVIPEEVINSKKDWIGDDSEINIVTKFMNDYDLTDDVNDYTKSEDIQKWLDVQKKGISIKKFSNDLKKYCSIKKLNNIESKNKKIGGKVLKAWIGVRIIEEEDNNPLDMF